MLIPENELGVIVVFSQICEAHNLEIARIKAGFPDALIKEISTGLTYKAEFEYRSSNFVNHGHDPRECDLIICWIDDLPYAGLPVIALSDPINFTPGDFVFRTTSDIEKENMYLRIQNAKLKYELARHNTTAIAGAKKSASSNGKVLRLDPPTGEGWRITIRRRKDGEYFYWRTGSRENARLVYGGALADLPKEVLEKYSVLRKV